MNQGITGRILRVNLTNGLTSIEKPSESFYRTYFGGRALIAYYLLNETSSHTEPLSPDNKVIFAAGPLTGSLLAGTGRSSVGTISPLTGGFGDSEAGGYWGAELKKANYDAIIIEGKASKPVYLMINNEAVEIRDADHLWGLKTVEVEEKLKKELDRGVRVCQIGPAGEKKLLHACVIHDLTHFAGRTGIGAVLGSKNLKAIAVKGNRNVEYAHREKVMELARWMGRNYKKFAWGLQKYGTAGNLMPLQYSGSLPTRNFREGIFDGAKKIAGETLYERYLVDRDTCFACPIKCKRVVRTGAPYNVDSRYGGPEFETIGSLGSLCGIDDLEAICKGNELCNAYGIDTISTGVAIAFAMECYEEGIITKGDTGGIDLIFGNAEGMLEMIDQIVNQKNLGKLLSKGVYKAAREIGGEAIKYAMHVKGLEIPIHEPRSKPGLAVGFAVSPTGADHCHNYHDTFFEKSVKSLLSFGILEPLPIPSLQPEKIRQFTYFTNWRHFGNCAIYCIFVTWRPNQLVEMIRAVTGWDTSLWELMKVGERAATLAQIINLRRGFSNNDAKLNKRFYEELPSGSLKGVKLDEDSVTKAICLYYGMMGWNEKGIPYEAKLYELNIGWARNLLDH